MEDIIIFLLKIVTTPIQRFWANAQNLWENRLYGKLALSFLASLLCIILMGLSITALVVFLINFHFEVILIIGGIIFLYCTVKAMFPPMPKATETVEETTNTSLLYESAVNGYASMRTIVFKTFRESATSIDCLPPRGPSDIEVHTEKFILAHDCAFYQFHIKKAQIKNIYPTAELNEFKQILQSSFKRLWESGQFSHIELSVYNDGTGIILDPVIITNLDDLGDVLLLQVVYTSPAYVSYMRPYWTSQNVSQSLSYPTNDNRFL